MMSETQQSPPTAVSEPSPAERPRRNFLVSFSATLVGLVVGMVPIFAGLLAFFDPLTRKKRVPKLYAGGTDGKEGFVQICSLDALTVGGAPQRFPVIDNQIDGWNFTPQQPVGSVYVQRIDANQVRVFNTTCPHAGCSVAFDGQAFNCPCHNSAFNLDGTKRESASGRENPSPRPLDELIIDEDKLAQGEVWVKYQDFYTGRAQQIAKS